MRAVDGVPFRFGEALVIPGMKSRDGLWVRIAVHILLGSKGEIRRGRLARGAKKDDRNV
jgi:hypothetical protein